MKEEKLLEEVWGVGGGAGGGAVPLSLLCRALSSVSMRGKSSLDGQLQKKHQTVKDGRTRLSTQRHFEKRILL